MKPKVIIISVVVIVLIIVGGYYFSTRVTSVVLPVEPLLNINAATTARERQPPDGWREYRNDRYSFSLFSPKGMTVKTFDEGGGATTIVFENVKDTSGFQIFVVPYSGEQVSDERFLMDVPSGIRKNPSDFYIDGVVATSFYSMNIGLGDTFEVWFIHEGFLYELTTLKPLEGFLKEIAKTWLFI